MKAVVSELVDCHLLISFLQLRDDLARGPACALDLFGLEGDRADDGVAAAAVALADRGDVVAARARAEGVRADGDFRAEGAARDRKSTRLNSSHSQISYAVFCLEK